MNFIRVQIMLEPRQHNALKKAADRSNKSVSQLLRDITNTYLVEMFPEEDAVLRALHTLRSIRVRQPLVEEDTVLEILPAQSQQSDLRSDWQS
jgi:hypothetical protein